MTGSFSATLILFFVRRRHLWIHHEWIWTTCSCTTCHTSAKLLVFAIADVKHGCSYKGAVFLSLGCAQVVVILKTSPPKLLPEESGQNGILCTRGCQKLFPPQKRFWQVRRETSAKQDKNDSNGSFRQMRKSPTTLLSLMLGHLTVSQQCNMYVHVPSLCGPPVWTHGFSTTLLSRFPCFRLPVWSLFKSIFAVMIIGDRLLDFFLSVHHKRSCQSQRYVEKLHLLSAETTEHIAGLMESIHEIFSEVTVKTKQQQRSVTVLHDGLLDGLPADQHEMANFVSVVLHFQQIAVTEDDRLMGDAFILFVCRTCNIRMHVGNKAPNTSQR